MLYGRRRLLPAIPLLLAHRVNVVGAWEGASPDLVRIAFDSPFDRGTEIAEPFDEFRNPRRQPEHILQHQHLPVTGYTRTNADRRNCDLLGDAAAQGLGDRFEHDGKRTSIGDG